jgi:hypothetical protein
MSLVLASLPHPTWRCRVWRLVRRVLAVRRGVIAFDLARSRVSHHGEAQDARWRLRNSRAFSLAVVVAADQRGQCVECVGCVDVMCTCDACARALVCACVAGAPSASKPNARKVTFVSVWISNAACVFTQASQQATTGARLPLPAKVSACVGVVSMSLIVSVRRLI